MPLSKHIARISRTAALLLLAATAWSAFAPAKAFALTDEQIAGLQSDAKSDAAPNGTAAAAGPSTALILGRMLLSLGAVFALMGGAVWLARKYMPAVKQGGRAGGIDVISTRSIGGRRSLMLVRARGKTILIGVSPQSIQTLSEFEEEREEWQENAWRAGLENAAGGAAAASGSASGTTGMER